MITFAVVFGFALIAGCWIGYTVATMVVNWNKKDEE